ncbi:glycosyltransferase family 9 protein [Nodosilinea sp. LEGE 06152]|uniref:glycosyltransferase family 9 protein n=1 Tax=Nodosilinea sp. LEGE 06152 TaxID=2777966 RepID=UPI00187FFD91|nr:glycosyltransferase family 9 protein [Nodosilinea sp. LEGE 06152]MBE9159299.1 glycosyltransferase family 9 protein [Nodosilinea sp. LEGE 06152]
MAYRLPIPAIARILVVRALPGLGDLLCAVPALRSLRQAYPQAKITWLGLPGTEWFGQRFAHLIDRWLPFPGFPGIPEGWQGPQATIDFCQSLQSQAYDLTLQMHGSGSYINPFLTLLGGQHQAGFYLPGQYCPNPHYFLPYPQQGSEVDRLLDLMLFLGLPETNRTLEFPLAEVEYQAGLQLLEAHSLVPGQYICLHPGASIESRRWSTVGFIEVARQLASQGHRIVLTGTAAERRLTNQVSAAINQPGTPLPVNLAGRTCLGALSVLLRHAALLVCNDTGISHLGAALKTPSVVIFSDSDMQRWAPLNEARHRRVDSRQAGSATPARVLVQAHDLLSSPHGPESRPESRPESLMEACYGR